jgi:hypothetical protein
MSPSDTLRDALRLCIEERDDEGLLHGEIHWDSLARHWKALLAAFAEWEKAPAPPIDEQPVGQDDYKPLDHAMKILGACTAQYTGEQAQAVAKVLKQWRDKWAAAVDCIKAPAPAPAPASGRLREAAAACATEDCFSWGIGAGAPILKRLRDALAAEPEAPPSRRCPLHNAMHGQHTRSGDGEACMDSFVCGCDLLNAAWVAKNARFDDERRRELSEAQKRTAELQARIDKLEGELREAKAARSISMSGNKVYGTIDPACFSTPPSVPSLTVAEFADAVAKLAKAVKQP